MLLKYDDVISMLTVVNILAKDVNYGVGIKELNYNFCNENQILAKNCLKQENNIYAVFLLNFATYKFNKQLSFTVKNLLYKFWKLSSIFANLTIKFKLFNKILEYG